MRDIVGNGALVRLGARAGMTRFAIHRLWGLTRITARDQTRLWPPYVMAFAVMVALLALPALV